MDWGFDGVCLEIGEKVFSKRLKESVPCSILSFLFFFLELFGIPPFPIFHSSPFLTYPIPLGTKS